jgi:putative oxidoreductase
MSFMTMSKAGKITQAGTPSRAMNIGLWIVQVFLAVVFLAHGWLMVAPPPELVEMINAQLGVGLRLFIGVAEVLAAFGLILPSITRILPFLTAWAAAGLMIVMTCATVLHLVRGESVITTIVLFVLATLVAYARSKVVPIAPRGRA